MKYITFEVENDKEPYIINAGDHYKIYNVIGILPESTLPKTHKIKIIYSCSNYAHHEHSTFLGALICACLQIIIKDLKILKKKMKI